MTESSGGGLTRSGSLECMGVFGNKKIKKIYIYIR